MEEYLRGEDLRKITILNSRERIGFQINWKEDTVVKKFEDNCLDYLKLYNFCKENGKSLITVSQHEEGKKLAEDLKTGLFTSNYFSEDLEYDFGQVEIFWTIDGVEFKSKLDKVVVANNRIIPVDIKTYYLNFMESFYTHKLYLQASMYSAPLKMLSNLSDSSPFLRSDIKIKISNKKLEELLKNPNYALDSNFIFLTVDKSGKNPPLPYAISQETLEKYVLDISIIRQDTGESIQLPGWIPKSQELDYHIKNNQWEYSKELINNGIISIKND